MAWQPTASDIRAVQNTIANYSIYLDSKNFDALPTIFHGESAIVDYRAIAGGSESSLLTGANSIVEWLRDRVKGRITHHGTTTQKLEFSASDRCEGTTYFTADAFFSAPQAPQAEGVGAGSPMVHYSVFGSYLDVLVLVDGEWKIAERTVVTRVRRSTCTPFSGCENMKSY
jgi:hypothetical protein